MKNDYLDIMARVVEVYSGNRFDDYIDNVKEHGITEHGFPRLCANIGILMAHGRKLELKSRFDEMMELCCRDIPTLYSGILKSDLNCIFVWVSIVLAVVTATLESLSNQEGAEGVMYDTDL